MNIASLLQRSEGDTLDFKLSNYRFQSAGNDEKSELLKDILAMSNAWKATDAYIIIGVEEHNGRPTNICGVVPELNDADVQQFVNSKANRPVSFAIEHIQHEQVQLTVIRVSQKQARPVFLVKDFGRLKRNVVYIRHGSSTDEASPDEIADMAKQDVPVSAPDVTLRFEVLRDAYTWNDDHHFGRQSKPAQHSDGFQIIARNVGNAAAHHIEGTIVAPRSMFCDYLEAEDFKGKDPIVALATATAIELEFSNYLREPTGSYLMKPNPKEWKPLLPGREMCLFCEQAIPMREGFLHVDAAIGWELAVDNCALKRGSTRFSDILIVGNDD